MVEFTLFEFLTPGTTGRYGLGSEIASELVDTYGKDIKPDDYVGLILAYFGSYGLFTHHFSRVPREIAAAELEVELVAEEGSTYPLVTFSMAKFARLPGVHPAAELRELCDLFASFRPVFEKFPGAFPSICIQNNRDEADCTYGTLEIGMREATEEEEQAAKIASAEAMARIAASPALSAWLQQLALDLDTMGPYSWCRLSDENFYEFNESPLTRYLQSNPAPRKPKKPEPKVDAYGRRVRRNTGKKRSSFVKLW